MMRSERVRVGKQLMAGVVLLMQVKDAELIAKLEAMIAGTLNVEQEEIAASAKLDFLVEEVSRHAQELATIRSAVAAILVRSMGGNVKVPQDLYDALGIQRREVPRIVVPG